MSGTITIQALMHRYARAKSQYVLRNHLASVGCPLRFGYMNCPPRPEVKPSRSRIGGGISRGVSLILLPKTVTNGMGLNKRDSGLRKRKGNPILMNTASKG
jgi:hypothetical protein